MTDDNSEPIPGSPSSAADGNQKREEDLPGSLSECGGRPARSMGDSRWQYTPSHEQGIPQHIGYGEVVFTSHSGSLPPAEELSRYEQAVSGSAERIIAMAETTAHAQRVGVEADADVQHAEAESIRATDRRALIELIVYTCLVVLGLFFAVYLVMHDKIAPSAIAAIFTAFFAYQSRRKV